MTSADPRTDDSTVIVSNVSSPAAPDVATIADDDPDCLSIDKQNHFNLLNQGWVQHDDSNEDDLLDDFDFDFNDNRVFSTALAIHAIDVNLPPAMRHADILPYVGESDDSSVASSNTSCASLIIQEDALPVVDDDPDAVRAQIDTGAFASVTDQLHMLHDYREFSATFPCPVKLEPAKEGSDIYPQGVGYLHVPAINGRGHIPVRTFYSPSLRTTVIDERDFLRSHHTKPSDFLGERIQKFSDAGTFAYHATHRLRRSQDVNVYGILRHGKCYTSCPHLLFRQTLF